MAVFRRDHERWNRAVDGKAGIFGNRHFSLKGFQQGRLIKVNQNVDQAARAAVGVDVLDIL